MEIKSSLITIAWPRNWFQRWLSRPYIGNFDLILVSSDLSRVFFEDYNKKYQFRTKCLMGCPYLPITSLNFTSKHPSKKLTSFQNYSKIGETTYVLPEQTSGARLPTPIGLLRLATASQRFSPGKANNSTLLSDYGFTASYHNTPRYFTEWDPSTLSSKYKGIVVGANWDQANLSTAWKQMLIGPVPYFLMPDVYRSIEIVVDDANYVTAPWASANSRIFDALASGSLVVTNGRLGVREILRNRVPVYSNLTDLAPLLRYYLSRSEQRISLVNMLRKQVLTKHTYDNRADELIQYLDRFNFGLGFIKSSNNTERSDYRYFPRLSTVPINYYSTSHLLRLCICIRTYSKQAHDLEILIRGLLSQYKGSTYRLNVALSIYVMDTDDQSIDFQVSNKLLVDKMNAKFANSGSRVYLLIDNLATEHSMQQNVFYGYDYTDLMLSTVLSKQSCDFLMFTNGDNLYNNVWFDTVAPVLLSNQTLNIVAWDFISHHNRNGTRQQPIQVAIERQRVDLGSMIIRAKLFSEHQIRFLPKSIFTGELFARDWFVIDKLNKSIAPSTVHLIHRVLLFHQ